MIEQLRITHAFSQEFKLHNVNLTIYHKEIVGVVVRSGANGRGLFQLLTGKAVPSFGTLYLDGIEANLYGQDTHKLGVGSISKKPQLVPNLSVFENIFVLTQGSYFRPLLPRRVYIDETQRLLKEAGLEHISPTAKAWALSQSEAHLIEIIKMRVLGTKVLIIDDVTSNYTENELERLGDFLLQQKEQGLSILFITNRYSLLFNIANQITIMRGGTTVVHERHSLITPEKLGVYLGDGALPPFFSGEVLAQSKTPCLELVGFQSREINRPLSLVLEEGEVLGVLETGANRGTAIGRALYGLAEYTGQVCLKGQRITINKTKEALGHGLIYLEANEPVNSIFYNMGLVDNITILLGKEYDKAFGLTSRRIARYKVEEAIEDLGLGKLKERYPLYKPIRSATPIDRMRIQLARAYATQPQVLLLANPHIGFGEMRLEDFRGLLKAFLNKGTSVLIFSTNRQNLDEVCDRIVEL